MRKIFILLLIIFSLNSCDILRTSLFEVTSWSPGSGYHAVPEEIVVSLNFSGEPDRDSVERHFSLTGDNGKVKGTFLWEDKKVIFTPLSPLEKNSDYTLSISAEAHDIKGLSMDDPFFSYFNTREDNVRPVLLSCYPLAYEEINDTRAEIFLSFSIPVPLKTLSVNVSFFPSMNGYWRLEDENKLAIFTPLEQWLQNTRYEIRISNLLTDNNGMNIPNELLSIFSIGIDHELPELLYAQRISRNNDSVNLNKSSFAYVKEQLIENSGWEKDDKLNLVFSKPVDVLSVKNCLNVDEASGLVMETPLGFNNEIVFRFNAPVIYGSRFAFRLKPGVKDSSGNESKEEYIYRIYADGESSKPPVLKGIRISLSPNNAVNKGLVSFDTESLFSIIRLTNENYPPESRVETWIELYFETSLDVSIDRFSLMENFRIETTNGALSFSPRQIKTESFSVLAPHPGWENYTRLEISGILTNSIHFGIINIQIMPGLIDSHGNKNEKLQRISLIK